MIDTVLFDFGGCIDGNGKHPRLHFFQAFLKTETLEKSELSSFQDAYTAADQKILKESLVQSLSLYPMNLLMTELICEHLELTAPAISDIASQVTAFQSTHIKASKNTLKELSRDFTLGIVSNFSGNLENILREFGIRDYFAVVVDSFYTDYMKPDFRLFDIALRKLNKEPFRCLYVGDNPTSDIAPSQQLGMKAILIHEADDTLDCTADGRITDFAELLDLTHRI